MKKRRKPSFVEILKCMVDASMGMNALMLMVNNNYNKSNISQATSWLNYVKNKWKKDFACMVIDANSSTVYMI